MGETGVARPDGSFRYLIRSQARRRRHRRDEKANAKRKLLEIFPKAKDTIDAQIEFPNRMSPSLSHQLKSGLAYTTLCRNPDKNRMDPFDTLPVRMEVGHIPELIRHFFPSNDETLYGSNIFGISHSSAFSTGCL